MVCRRQQHLTFASLRSCVGLWSPLNAPPRHNIPRPWQNLLSANHLPKLAAFAWFLHRQALNLLGISYLSDHRHPALSRSPTCSGHDQRSHMLLLIAVWNLLLDAPLLRGLPWQLSLLCSCSSFCPRVRPCKNFGILASS